ncbi:hypothetical protein A9K75_07820 [Campylobacter fetus subsp. testudinum]|uniref:hypothetical protein n=1 Tax=Campylobacter fetus TaxID=196 RepID=UPI000818955E|nr:hypothetical protein [Campylobacter fetus]OCR99224.1 hypothetical protein A9K75_07820 [Campylobacter fetus subsp. testudinum]OCS09373.1 hypothetical protein CFTD6783_08380 [Campylobacter fetus subsp. testudinum]
MQRIRGQREWIKEQLLSHGQISRNLCLENYITRLSGHIFAIKEANPRWIVKGKRTVTKNGEDFVYSFINKDEIMQILSA